MVERNESRENFMVNKFDFGVEAVSYIKTCLSQGDTLSNFLLKLPLEDGDVTSYLPDNSTFRDAVGFSTGGKIKKYSAEHILAEYISEYFSRQSMSYALFEAIERPTDPYLSSINTNYFVYKTEIYYFLTAGSSNNENIINILRTARAYPCVGILTTPSEKKPTFSTGQKLTLNDLRMFVTRTEHIIVDAYDGEGYVIWSK